MTNIKIPTNKGELTIIPNMDRQKWEFYLKNTPKPKYTADFKSFSDKMEVINIVCTEYRNKTLKIKGGVNKVFDKVKDDNKLKWDGSIPTILSNLGYISREGNDVRLLVDSITELQMFVIYFETRVYHDECKLRKKEKDRVEALKLKVKEDKEREKTLKLVEKTTITQPTTSNVKPNSMDRYMKISESTIKEYRKLFSEGNDVPWFWVKRLLDEHEIIN